MSSKEVPMDGLIGLVNGIQDIFTKSGVRLDMKLPQIVVVGGQSTGKSSVLENVVGRDFLPRGTGIVTRVPLILQLVHLDCNEEYGEFAHKDQTFTDFSKIREEIIRQTDSLVGSSKGICRDPIRLRIHSRQVLSNLTLVDLPGLTMVPLPDQPEDIVEQIEDLVMEFVRDPNSIILAVTSANEDLVNSSALNIARKVDPRGRRTIGVLTKLDMMAPGTNARDVIENRVVPLDLGYVGVVNRSKKDLDGNVDIKTALKKEEDFFRKTAAYRDLISKKVGCRVLQERLCDILRSHILQCLPDYHSYLYDKAKELQQELTKYEYLVQGEHAKDLKLSQMLEDFKRTLRREVFGNDVTIDSSSLTVGAVLLHTLYNDVFARIDERSKGNGEDEQRVCVAIANLHSHHNTLSLPELAFDTVVRELVLEYKHPLEEAVKTVAAIILKSVRKYAEPMKQYPQLWKEVVFHVSQHVSEQENKCREQLVLMVEAERSFINTRHPDFNTDEALAGPPDVVAAADSNGTDTKEEAAEDGDEDWHDGDDSQLSAKTNKTNNIGLIRNEDIENIANRARDEIMNDTNNRRTARKVLSFVRTYMNIVDKSIRDQTIKYLTLLLIHNTVRYVENELSTDLKHQNGTKHKQVDLMAVDQREQERCQELKATLSSVQSAIEMIQDSGVPDTVSVESIDVESADGSTDRLSDI